MARTQVGFINDGNIDVNRPHAAPINNVGINIPSETFKP